MGSSKRNLLTSILLLVVMGVFAVLTIFIVVDAINKKYYNDIKVEYEVQEEEKLNNVILTFARNEGSAYSTETVKAVRNPEDETKFRIDGTVPTIENGVVTNLDDLTSSDGREFYFFSTNSSFIDPQEDPENPDFIFSETDSRYYVSTESDPIWYDVPKSSENLTLYAVFLTPNVHNSDFANAPLLNTSPDVIISHDVTEIPYNAFSNALMEGDLSMAAKIESVVIPNSTKSINSELNIDLSNGPTGSGAFAGCTTLTNIAIPSSVEYVGGEAFMFCTGLDTTEYGNGYYLPTENNKHAILIDTNIKAENVTIHEACISIQGNTFSKYMSLMLGLITPGEEESEEDYVNINLQEITIPKNVKNIGYGAFTYCMGLTNIEFEEDSNLTNIGIYSFIGCSRLKTINLEATKLEEIGAMAFGFIEEDIMPSTVIEEITLPSTLKTIGMGAFVGCTSLRTVTFENNSQLTSIGEYVFYNCSSLTSITILESVTSIGDYAFSNCSSLTSIIIPDSVTSIEDYAFMGCGSLEEVTFGENSQLTNIGKLTFGFCKNLISIAVPKSVTSIGAYAFSNCYKLVEVYDLTGPNGLNITAGSSDNGGVGYYAVEIKKENIPTGIYYTGTNNEYIMYEDLNGNHYLVGYLGDEENLTLPTFDDRTYSIKNYAFCGEDKLTSITIPESVTSIGERAFDDCSSLTSITIPKSVTSMGDYAFYYCRNIQKLYIDNLTSYLNILDSFSSPLYSANQAVSLYVGGELITNLVIPDGVTEIPDYAFNRVTNITSVTIPNGVTSIGASTFYSCSNLETVDFGDNSQLTSIGDQAFYNCSSLETINFGDNSMLTSIGYEAFRNCSGLTSIKIPDSVTSIGTYAFRSCSGLTSITIPSSVTSMAGYVFQSCNKLTIYCEASSQPSGWDSDWNYSSRPVYWGGEWKMVDGVPVPIESGVEGVGLSEIGEDFGIGFDGLGFREELYFNDKRERKVV